MVSCPRSPWAGVVATSAGSAAPVGSGVLGGGRVRYGGLGVGGQACVQSVGLLLLLGLRFGKVRNSGAKAAVVRVIWERKETGWSC